MREKSPYVLLQEILWPNRWQSTVACVLLNRTKRAQVDKVWPELFSRAPDPQSLLNLNDEELKDMLKPLGLSKVRSARLKKLAEAWLKGTDFEKLPGVGEYAEASDRIFYRGEIINDVKDHALAKYVGWLNQKNEK
jgi:endonuclease III